jgi:uncharacterized protein (TIGR03067 family)
MIRRFALLACAVAVAAAPLVAAPQAGSAAVRQGAAPAPSKLSPLMASVQGTWQMVTVNGQDAAGSGQVVTITISDNKYVQTVNGQIVERGTFKLDDTKKPTAIDIMITEGDNANQTQLGVVEITGKTMKGKIADPGVTTRPVDFNVAEGTFVFVMNKK